MMERLCRWGLLVLIVPLLGCGPAEVETPTSDAATSAAAASDGAARTDAADAARIDSSDAQTPVVTPSVAPPTPSPTPALPVELPAPPADEELRRRIAELYSPQVQQLIAEKKPAEADQLRAGAIAFIRSQGAEAFDKLKGAMLDPSVDVRRGAAWYLFEIVDKHDPQMVAVFVQALADQDRIVRQLALAGLKSLPPEALVQFQSQLLSLLEKGQEEAADRAAIAQLIGRLGSDAAPAFAVLARLARDDPGAEVRLQCLLAASRLTSSEQAAAMFRAALADGDAKVRKLAVVRLGALGPASAAAVGDLAKTLKDQDEIVREYAAVSLGKLGVIGSPAIGALIEAFGDPAERVRRAAADALAGVGDAAVDPLVRQLEAGPPQTRQLAIVALSRLGATAKRAEPALRKRLEDPDPQVRELAQAALEVLASFR